MTILKNITTVERSIICIMIFFKNIYDFWFAGFFYPSGFRGENPENDDFVWGLPSFFERASSEKSVLNMIIKN